MHSGVVQVEIHALSLSAAEQNEADSSLVPLHLHVRSFCSSYKGALTNIRCTAAGLRSKSMPWRSVLLSHNKLTAVLCHCSYTLKILLFLQGCNHKPKMHCSRVQVKMPALMLSFVEP